jgi:hypothetical protein
VPPQSEDKPLSALALDSINAAVVERAAVDADDCTTLEQIEILKGKAELASFNQDTGERKRYAKNIFILTCLWVGGIYVLLLLQGFGLHFRLGENVLLAAIGSTTANIIGVFLIVTRYFFPKKH